MHFNSRYRYFSALATLLCLLASCYPSLSLRAIVPTEKIVQSWKFQSIPILFAATFNGIIRWKLKSLADTIVVIIALKILRLSEWSLLDHLHTRRPGKPAAISLETWGSNTCNLLLQGHSSSTDSCHIRSLQVETRHWLFKTSFPHVYREKLPSHSGLWYYRICIKTVYSVTQNYSTEAVSIISTLRENRDPPVSSPDVAQWQNNTSYIKPFKANTLILSYQGISGHQPEKWFVLISSILWKGKNAISSPL